MQTKRLVVVTLATALVLLGTFPPWGSAKEPDPTRPHDPGFMMTTDLVLARPVGLAATVTGFAVFLVSSPFSLLGGNAGEAWDNLVEAPAAYTFNRPLGNFDKPESNTPPPPPPRP